MSEALVIMLENLNSETQKEVLKFYGYETAAEGDLDIIPLFVLDKEKQKDRPNECLHYLGEV